MSEERSKNKNIILISSIIAIIIIIVIGVVCYFIKPQAVNQNEGEKISKLYESLKEKSVYSFETKLDKENKTFFEKQSNQAYLEEIIDGNTIETIVKNGNTYLIKDDEKVYYTYRNNDTNLNKIEEILEEVKDLEYEIGKEKINDKTYTYLEVAKLTDFTMMDLSGAKQVKTRFYFDGDKLDYIKTIADKKEELLKVTISDNVDRNLFEIPTDYEEK